MKKNILTALALFTTLSAQATQSPVDYFRQALVQKGYTQNQVAVVTTYNPFNYLSRGTYYLDRAAQFGLNDGRIAWKFYRIQFRDENNQLMDCTGGIGFEKGHGDPSTRIVDIEGCNQNFFKATTLCEIAVTLE